MSVGKHRQRTQKAVRLFALIDFFEQLRLRTGTKGGKGLRQTIRHIPIEVGTQQLRPDFGPAALIAQHITQRGLRFHNARAVVATHTRARTQNAGNTGSVAKQSHRRAQQVALHRHLGLGKEVFQGCIERGLFILVGTAGPKEIDPFHLTVVDKRINLFLQANPHLFGGNKIRIQTTGGEMYFVFSKSVSRMNKIPICFGATAVYNGNHGGKGTKILEHYTKFNVAQTAKRLQTFVADTHRKMTKVKTRAELHAKHGQLIKIVKPHAEIHVGIDFFGRRNITFHIHAKVRIVQQRAFCTPCGMIPHKHRPVAQFRS